MVKVFAWRSRASWVSVAALVVMLGASACAAGEGSDTSGGKLSLGHADASGDSVGDADTSGSTTSSEDESTTASPSSDASASDASAGDASTGGVEPGDTEQTSATDSGDSSGGDASFCGDGVVDEGEECDDGQANADDAACKSDCTLQVCGDGHVGPDEACDDGAGNAWDAACLPDCTVASCGDGHVHAGVEVCDDGVNDGAYGGCMPGCGALAPHCGDGVLQAQHEHCDTALPQPFPDVPCSSACLYDFSTVPQLYCNGTCSWAGAQGCDQADADVYCKLRTGNSGSVATGFQVVTALAQHGFSCPNYGNNLGPLPEFGVNQNVWYQATSLSANHGAGSVVANVTCTDP
jgi:hypothetical protein